MSGKFFTDMAVSGICRNRQGYLPYALSCAGTVMVFYLMHVLAHTRSLQGIYGGRTIQRTLFFGIWVMGLFAVIFLLYTHSFLLKRRRKEFGLLQVLGLEKRHLGRVLALETAMVAVLTTAAGMLMGILFSRLFYLVLLRILGTSLSPQLHLPPASLVITLVLFLSIHVLTVVHALRQVHTQQTSSLLKGSSLGEKPLRAPALSAVPAILCLAGGYFLSMTAQDVINSITRFFWAVLLVIIGTYLLFWWGAPALLRRMQKNPRFYYQPRHFSVVAGLLHRMRRNAVGLASICILSTMVLVMISATASLFIGREDVISVRYADREAAYTVSPVQDRQVPALHRLLEDVAKEKGVSLRDVISFRSLLLYARMDAAAGNLSSVPWEQLGGRGTETVVHLIPWEDAQTLYPDAEGPAAGEALLFSASAPPLPAKITLDGMSLTLRQTSHRLQPIGSLASEVSKAYVLVMQEADLLQIALKSAEAIDPQPMNGQVSFRLNTAFNTPGTEVDAAWEVVDTVQKRAAALVMDSGGGANTWAHHAALERADFNAIYGGLLFVAVFLGLLFVMAMVLIIYYKQVNEGHEDRRGFVILQQVGMSQQEVRASIRSQVLMVFFLPLALSGLHVLAAFNIMGKVLGIMNLTNLRLYALVALISYVVFSFFYAAVFWKTSHSYYKIVRA